MDHQIPLRYASSYFFQLSFFPNNTLWYTDLKHNADQQWFIACWIRRCTDAMLTATNVKRAC